MPSGHWCRRSWGLRKGPPSAQPTWGRIMNLGVAAGHLPRKAWRQWRLKSRLGRYPASDAPSNRHLQCISADLCCRTAEGRDRARSALIGAPPDLRKELFYSTQSGFGS